MVKSRARLARATSMEKSAQGGIKTLALARIQKQWVVMQWYRNAGWNATE